MAHKRKDNYTASPEHWRHLRPYTKRRVAKAERRAARTLVAADRAEDAALVVPMPPKRVKELEQMSAQEAFGVLQEEFVNIAEAEKRRRRPRRSNG